MNLLAIDPGLAGTGWAIWDDRLDESAPIAVGVIQRLSAKIPWWTRALTIADSLCALYGRFVTEHEYPVVCEFPEFHESSGRQMGWRTGDLQKLTFLTGVIQGVMAPRPFFPVTPNEWKGQLPKHVVEHRIRRQLGEATCLRLDIRSHAWDATGLGLWWLDHQTTRKVSTHESKNPPSSSTPGTSHRPRVLRP